MRLEQRAVFCRSLQVSVSRLSPRPPLNNKPLIHNGLAVFFYAFFLLLIFSVFILTFLTYFRLIFIVTVTYIYINIGMIVIFMIIINIYNTILLIYLIFYGNLTRN